MSPLFLALLASTTLTAAATPLAITLAAAPHTANTTTSTPFETTHPSISPAANTDVYVFFGWRAGSTLRTNNAPTAGFATVAGFSSVANRGLLVDDAGGNSNCIRGQVWVGRTTGSPGSGTVVCSTNASTFTQFVAVVYVEAATGNLRIIEYDVATGTTGSAPWDSTPSGHRASAALVVQNGTTGTLAFDDELVAIASSPFDVGSASFHLGLLLGTISDPQDVSGGQDGRRKVVVGFSVTGAAA